MYNARELAMTRMEEEAAELGADGVVGVRLTVNYYDWARTPRSSLRRDRREGRGRRCRASTN